MRTLLLGLIVTLGVPATAGAAFAPPISIPVSSGERPFATASGGAIVTQTGGPPYSEATLAVITVATKKRQTFKDTVLLDQAPAPGGIVDLLVRRGSDYTKRGDLILRRVRADGSVHDVWSVRTAATDGALARRGARSYVIWPEGSTLRVVSRPDGGIPSKPRIARVALRGGYYSDLDLAIDTRGRLVAAVSSPRIGLLLASLTARGTVLQRQLARSAGGLVSIAMTSAGRVGVLAEDTGIEGDGGECVSDGEGRHIRVAVREAAAARFGAAQTVESPPFGCGASGALLRATSPYGLTVVYQGGSYDRPPLLVRSAFSDRGTPFGAPVTLATDARADRAVVTPDGELIITLVRKTAEPEVFSGALSVMRSGRPEELISAGPASSPLLATGLHDRAVLVWFAGGALQVAVDQP